MWPEFCYYQSLCGCLRLALCPFSGSSLRPLKAFSKAIQQHLWENPGCKLKAGILLVGLKMGRLAMKSCPVGKLGRHDMRIVGDELRCRLCPATQRWRRSRKAPPIVINRQAQDHERATSVPQTWSLR